MYILHVVILISRFFVSLINFFFFSNDNTNALCTQSGARDIRRMRVDLQIAVINLAYCIKQHKY